MIFLISIPGSRILSRKIAEMMARDSLGGVRHSVPQHFSVATGHDGASAWLGPGQSWGLGFSIVTDPGKAGYVGSPGTLVWGGIFGTEYMVRHCCLLGFLSNTCLLLNEPRSFLHVCQIDPEEGVCAILLTQRFPNKGQDLRGKFPQLVMQALL